MFFKAISICFILSTFQPPCTGFAQFKDLYFTIESKDELTSFLDTFQNDHCDEMRPYLASATMLQAKYSFFPHKKFQYFISGKKMLEAYIKDNPDNIEGRYIRLITQINTPGFLGYRKNIVEDKSFVESHVDNADLSLDYRNKIQQTISELNSK
ncbi:MAG: hypothetical protein KJP00_10775 [Bacteroidia bacterium]|nr:hypothetical protein [Bacteroidia bacterium]